ncbi:ATP-dependent translocase ABCB1-like [Branchiostoma floridae x Branchiostoma japonicum]
MGDQDSRDLRRSSSPPPSYEAAIRDPVVMAATRRESHDYDNSSYEPNEDDLSSRRQDSIVSSGSETESHRMNGETQTNEEEFDDDFPNEGPSENGSVVANGDVDVKIFSQVAPICRRKSYEDAFEIRSSSKKRRKWKVKKEKEEKKEGEEEKTEMIGFSELMRYADKVDVIYMILGTICSVLDGVMQPILLYVMGNMVDVFTNYGKFDAICREVFGYSSIYNCTFDNATFANFSLTEEHWEDALGITLVMADLAYYFVGLAFGVVIFGYLQIAFWTLAGARQTRRIRQNFFRAVMRQEVGWFDTNPSGELNSVLADDMNKVQEAMSDKVSMFIQRMTTTFGGLILGFTQSWKLTLVIMFGCAPLLFIGAYAISKATATLSEKVSAAYSKAGAVAEEILSSIRTVAAFGGEKKAADKYYQNLGDAEKAGIRKGIITGVGLGYIWLIVFASYALAFYYGSVLVANEGFTVGGLITVFMGVLISAIVFGEAMPNLEVINTGRGVAKGIFEMIDRVPLIDSSSTEGLKLDNTQGNFEFKDIHFHYPARPEVKVLNGLNLQVRKGQTVALCGSSGCGKSTTVQLIQRFYDPTKGMVTLDGHDIRSLNIQWLRQNIGVVSQEPVLFATTIAENISYGRAGVTQEEIEKAAKEANAHDFIKRLPKKYNTLVGERGAQLSGGQKQRIAIARALVRNPKILLLDEATSALDTESEATVQEALDKARQGRTTIVIAHRLSTIKNADVIMGFRKGQVVEMGTHNQLMLKRGVYYHLVMSQTMKKVDNDSDEEEEDHLIRPRTHSRRSLRRSASGRRSMRGMVTERARTLSMLSAATSAAGDSSSDSSDEEEGDFINEASIGRIAKMNRSEWPYILFGVIGAFINGAIQPIFAVLFSEILNAFAAPGGNSQVLDSIMVLALMFLGLGLIALLSNILEFYMFAKSGEILTKKMRQLAFTTMLRQEIGWFDDHKNSTGALTTRLAADASMVQGATGIQLGSIVESVSLMGISIIIAFIAGWKLTFVVLGFLPFLVLSGAMSQRALQGHAARDKEALEECGKLATEAIENVRTVAALTKEPMFADNYNKSLYGPYKESKKKAHIFGFSYGFSQSIQFFAYAAAFSFGAWLITIQEMRFYEVFRVFSAIVFSGTALGRASSYAPDYAKAKMAAARIFDLVDRKPLIDSGHEGGDKPSNLVGNITFKDVRFVYPTRPDIRILNGLNTEIQAGQTCALVGSSGCGKSTSVSLLERFYDPIDGNVLIDNRDVRSLNIQWLRSQLGIVSQEPILFDMSIGDNIAYGDNSRVISQDEIVEAAKSANAHDFISALPDGYNTGVGDRGTQLSGGQKQRIAIARALVRKPKILLLDEATSALDTESEKVVQEALDRASQGRTCIVIAHRLTTIQDSDKIVVIHKGKKIEEGKHEKLMKLNGGQYRRLSVISQR